MGKRKSRATGRRPRSSRRHASWCMKQIPLGGVTEWAPPFNPVAFLLSFRFEKLTVSVPLPHLPVWASPIGLVFCGPPLFGQHLLLQSSSDQMQIRRFVVHNQNAGHAGHPSFIPSSRRNPKIGRFACPVPVPPALTRVPTCRAKRVPSLQGCHFGKKPRGRPPRTWDAESIDTD